LELLLRYAKGQSLQLAPLKPQKGGPKRESPIEKVAIERKPYRKGSPIEKESYRRGSYRRVLKGFLIKINFFIKIRNFLLAF
jgi:hypothetical protein